MQFKDVSHGTFDILVSVRDRTSKWRDAPHASVRKAVTQGLLQLGEEDAALTAVGTEMLSELARRTRSVVEESSAWILNSRSGQWWFTGVATMSGSPDDAARFQSKAEAEEATRTGDARYSHWEESWEAIHVTFRLVMVPKFEVIHEGQDISWASRVGVR